MIEKKNSKSFFPLLKFSWIGALLIGVTSCKHIPQVCTYPVEIIQPIAYEQGLQSLIPCKPISSFHINRSGYSLAYDARNRNPAWVYEHLTAESITGNADRSISDFKEDDSIPKHLRATLVDYKGSGFDRGHQAPAADHRSSQEAMADTFYLSNMCPQYSKFNRGYWAKFEKYVRDLTKDYRNVYVATGPLYLSHQEEDGKRYIKYQVIGPNEVAVPTHFFKVISCEDSHGKKATAAYILPNQDIPSCTPLEQFQTTVQKVEKASGIFFNN